MKLLKPIKPNCTKYSLLILFLFIFSLPSFLQALNISLENGINLYRTKSYKEAYAIFFQLQEKEKNSTYYFYLGNISHFLGKDDDAERWYLKGITLGKNVSQEFYFNFGLILIRNQKPLDAIGFLEKITKKNALVRSILAVLYYNDGNFHKAEYHLKNLMEEVKDMPDDFLVPIYENYFFTSLQLKNNYQAVNIGNLLKHFNDVSPDFWLNYAGVLSQTSQASKAIDVYRSLAEKEDLVKEQSHFKMVYLQAFKKKNYEEAFKSLEIALKKYPNQYQFNKVKAYLFYLTENWKEAWEILDKMIPQTKQDFKNKALVAYQNDKEKEAIQILENAYILYPEEDILTNLVSLYLKHNKLNQAELTMRLYQNKKKSDWLYLWLFQLALQKEDIKKAREYGDLYNASQHEKPYHFYYNLGKVYEKQAELNQAISFYRQAQKMAPDFPYPYVALANIYTAQKKYKEAEDNYLVALKLLPDFGIYYYQLAQVYALSENYFLAKELLKQALMRNIKMKIIEEDTLFTPVLKQFPDFYEEYKDF